jgi:hypothetical protein
MNRWLMSLADNIPREILSTLRLEGPDVAATAKTVYNARGKYDGRTSTGERQYKRRST